MTEAAMTSLASEVAPKADQDRTRTMSAVVAFQRLKHLLPPTMLVEVQEQVTVERKLSDDPDKRQLAEERTSSGGRR